HEARSFPHRRLRVEGETETGHGHHLQVVRSVADRNCRAPWHAEFCGPLLQGMSLCRSIHDLAVNATIERTISDRESVRAPPVHSQLRSNVIQNLAESARDNPDDAATHVHSSRQFAYSRRRLDT